MPIEFALHPFTTVSDVFLETGTYRGNGVIKAMEAGFKSIASVEVSSENLRIADERIKKHPAYQTSDIALYHGDSANRIDDLVQFAHRRNARHPVFWLDAHTHVFVDGTSSSGSACPLEREISAILDAFEGDAVLLVDDLRLIDIDLRLPRTRKSRLRAALYALFSPDQLGSLLRPGWGTGINLLSIMRLIHTQTAYRFQLLDGKEPKDVLCAYPETLCGTQFLNDSTTV